ncbi:MAG: AfsR/SARP family transcriptional regulator, partial [Trebonia sp.]
MMQQTGHGGTSDQVQVRLLGSLLADLDGYSITPSAAKQRQILALLAIRSGQLTTISTLTEELWGDNPPRTFSTTLQTYILQLRNRITTAIRGEREAHSILRTQYGGYLLDGPACWTDVAEFRRRAQAGRLAAEGGDYGAASELLGEALRLWRGSVLADVPVGQVLEIEALSLEETRLRVLERRIEADLALHRHADLIGELRSLTARHPMNENLAGFLMLAFYRSGNIHRALEEFHRLRGTLINEIGVDPSPRLQHLQQAVLSRDPSLEPGRQYAPLGPSWHYTPSREGLRSPRLRASALASPTTLTTLTTLTT